MRERTAAVLYLLSYLTSVRSTSVRFFFRAISTEATNTARPSAIMLEAMINKVELLPVSGRATAPPTPTTLPYCMEVLLF